MFKVVEVRIQGSGVQSLGFRGVGFRVQGLGSGRLRVEGSDIMFRASARFITFWVQGYRWAGFTFRVHGQASGSRPGILGLD